MLQAHRVPHAWNIRRAHVLPVDGHPLIEIDVAPDEVLVLHDVSDGALLRRIAPANRSTEDGTNGILLNAHLAISSLQQPTILRTFSCF